MKKKGKKKLKASIKETHGPSSGEAAQTTQDTQKVTPAIWRLGQDPIQVTWNEILLIHLWYADHFMVNCAVQKSPSFKVSYWSFVSSIILFPKSPACKTM